MGKGEISDLRFKVPPGCDVLSGIRVRKADMTEGPKGETVKEVQMIVDMKAEAARRMELFIKNGRKRTHYQAPN